MNRISAFLLLACCAVGVAHAQQMASPKVNETAKDDAQAANWWQRLLSRVMPRRNAYLGKSTHPATTRVLDKTTPKLRSGIVRPQSKAMPSQRLN